jgi:fatty-acyl-CoA synthase
VSEFDKSVKVVGDFFARHVKEKAGKDALVYKDRRVTWAEYDKQTDLVAMGLIKLGVKHSDRIGVYIPNWLEFIFAYMGAAKIGAITVPVSWRFTPQEIKFVINNAEISTLIMADGFFGMDFVKNLETIRSELPTLKHVVILNKEKVASGMVAWEDFLAEPGPELAKYEAAVKPDDAALFLFTSGTTGVPKASVLTHKNMIAYTDGQLIASKFEGTDETLLLNIPLNHVGGAVMAVIACLNAGNKLVMMDMFDPEKTLQLIQDEKVTVIGQVPAQYAMELLSPNIEKYDLSSIKAAVVSSQPCPSELIMAIKNKFGVMPQNAYGLTEVSGGITFTQIEHGEEKLKYTVGVPINGIDLQIMDPDFNILPKGQVGEIVVKGDAVMKGYWKRPDEDKRVFDKKGYFHTGDMGRLDEDGYLTIVGRKKEMYIRGGENVYPPEVEEAIAQHPDVFMVAVVGRPHSIFGEVGRAYIIPKPGTQPTADGMKVFLKDRLANYKIPEDISFRDQLPLTLLGKVKKLDLYQEIEQEFAKK